MRFYGRQSIITQPAQAANLRPPVWPSGRRRNRRRSRRRCLWRKLRRTGSVAAGAAAQSELDGICQAAPRAAAWAAQSPAAQHLAGEPALGGAPS